MIWSFNEIDTNHAFNQATAPSRNNALKSAERNARLASGAGNHFQPKAGFDIVTLGNVDTGMTPFREAMNAPKMVWVAIKAVSPQTSANELPLAPIEVQPDTYTCLRMEHYTKRHFF